MALAESTGMSRKNSSNDKSFSPMDYHIVKIEKSERGKFIFSCSEKGVLHRHSGGKSSQTVYYEHVL